MGRLSVLQAGDLCTEACGCVLLRTVSGVRCLRMQPSGRDWTAATRKAPELPRAFIAMQEITAMRLGKQRKLAAHPQAHFCLPSFKAQLCSHCPVACRPKA